MASHEKNLYEKYHFVSTIKTSIIHSITSNRKTDEKAIPLKEVAKESSDGLLSTKRDAGEETITE